MRYVYCLILITMLALAACNGSPTPAVPTLAATSASVAETATPDAQQQATPIAQITVPAVGTLIAPVTEDPEAGLVFDTIVFTQTGGSSNTQLTVELHSDGTLIRNGETITVSPDDIAAIDTMLDELNFFGIQGIFAAAAANPDLYSYSITVDRAGSSRTINAQDTYTPQELKELFAAIIGLGVPTQPAPGQP